MAAAPLRTQIETGLDDLIAHEGGMRFQPLAVVLAKQKWRELVAAERKKDLGLDAYVTSRQASDGIGRGLACSITADYDKIASDATKVRNNFGEQIQHLVFATSSKVGAKDKLEWGNDIRKHFGLELIIMGREEIVTSLSDPTNLALCRTYLGLDLEIEPSAADVAAAIREAAAAELGNWTRRQSPVLLELDVVATDDEKHAATRWSLDDISAALREGRRLILEAPAGRGKTTTLIQLASGPLSKDGTVFFLDLPSWVRSRSRVLPFISGMPAFEQRGLTSAQLAAAQVSERFYFVLNGWNEIGDNQFEDAAGLLSELDRQFPSAGILVASRPHHLSPLPGATSLSLRRVSHRARTDYLRARLNERSAVVESAIAANPALDSLTRTPFVLAEVAALVAAGQAIPQTRTGLLEAVTRLHEQSPDHMTALRSGPLRGEIDPFMEALAMAMVGRDAVEIPHNEAIAVIHGVTIELESSGRLLPRPTPHDVLNALTAHHLLERIEYPSTAYRFEHQLFEEFYASRGIGRQFAAVAKTAVGSVERRAFAGTYLNKPVWTEALHLLAESMADEPRGGDPGNSPGAALAEMAMSVDLVFAGQLIQALDLGSAHSVAKTFEAAVRRWYASPSEHHRSAALGAMLASGLDRFRDILEPLLSSENSQVSLPALRRWPGFLPTVLGPDWRAVVTAWPDEVRASFVRELLMSAYVPAVADFGLADESQSVRATTADTLAFIGAEEHFVRGVGMLDQETLSQVLLRIPADHVPMALRERAGEALRTRHQAATDGQTRLRTIRSLAALGDTDAINSLKRELDTHELTTKDEAAYRLLDGALDLIAATDPAWTSAWVSQRIVDGRLWARTWGRHVKAVPEAILEAAFERLTSGDLTGRAEGAVFVLGQSADITITRRAFDRITDLRERVDDRGWMSQQDSAVSRQLLDALRATPAETVISSVQDILESAPEPRALTTLVDLYGQTAMMDDGVIDLSPDSRRMVHRYLKRALPIALSTDDTGHLMAAFASLLSQVGERSDVEDVLSLVQADLRRMREGRAAKLRGERTDRADYSSNSYGYSYVRSIRQLAATESDDILFALLTEREYEMALRDLFVRQFGVPDGMNRRSTAEIVTARERMSVIDGRRARVAAALRQRIHDLEHAGQSDNDRQDLNYRLKHLATAYAHVDPSGAAASVLRIAALPGRFDAGMRVEILSALLFGGVTPAAGEVIDLLDEPIKDMSKIGIQDSDRWTILRFLALLPFVSPPEAGLEKIEAIITTVRLHGHDLRDLLFALGNSRLDSAVPLMQRIAAMQGAWMTIRHDWIDAVTILDTPLSRRLLLSFVDPDVPPTPLQLNWDMRKKISARLATLASVHPEIDKRLRELASVKLTDMARDIVAGALMERGNPEDHLAAIALLDDTRKPQIPQPIAFGLEEIFLSREPSEHYSGAYSLRPAAANPLRARLFELASHSTGRTQAAYSLLGQIEEWRLEYGRPIDEPRHPDFESGLPWPPVAPT